MLNHRHLITPKKSKGYYPNFHELVDSTNFLKGVCRFSNFSYPCGFLNEFKTLFALFIVPDYLILVIFSCLFLHLLLLYFVYGHT